MGQTEITSSLKNITSLSKHNFNFKEQIGSGGFSKVYKAFYPKIFYPLAIKEMSKQQIIIRNIYKSIISEKNILSKLYHPFIINIYASFQDQENLYLVMDYCPCGDLRYQMSYIQKYSEEQLRFIAGCIILGLEYIHSKGIIHRDIKPENIICDEKGFYRISDFGIASKINEDIQSKYDFFGTPGYISPEAVTKKHIGYESDFFSLGVILYELIFDDFPYKGKEKEQLLKEFNNKVEINSKECGYSYELCNFINGLLEVDNKKRLGRGGVCELKKHPFFKEFNWLQLLHKNKLAPIIPRQYQTKRKQLHSIRNKEELMSSKETSDTEHLSNISKYDYLFNDYNFIRKFDMKHYNKNMNNNNNNNSNNNKNKVVNDNLKIINRITSSIVSPIKANVKKYNSKSPKIKLFSHSLLQNSSINYSLRKQNSLSYLSKYSSQLPLIHSYNSKPIPGRSINVMDNKLKQSNRSVLSKNFLFQASIDEERRKFSINEMMLNKYNFSKKGKNNNFEQYMNLQIKSRSRHSLLHSLQSSINKTTLPSLGME